MFKRSGIYVGITAILVGALILWQAHSLHMVFALDPVGPAGVPSFLAWGMIAIGILLIIGGAFARKVTAPADKEAWNLNTWLKQYKSVLYIIIICLLYAALLKPLGYLIMTPVLIGGIMWVHQVRDIKHILKVSLFMTAILFVTFRLALQVKLPLGFLANLYTG